MRAVVVDIGERSVGAMSAIINNRRGIDIVGGRKEAQSRCRQTTDSGSSELVWRRSVANKNQIKKITENQLE